MPRNDGVKQRSRRPSVIAVVYFVLGIAGLIGTWYCNLTYTGGNYLGDWFANRAAASAAIDILTVFVVTAVFYVVESRRLGWRWWVPVVFVVLSAAGAVAFAFPTYLAFREIRRTWQVRQEHDG